MTKMAKIIMKNRFPILLIMILFTLFSLYEIKELSFKTRLSDTLPKDHPYVKVHERFWKKFGGANNMAIVVEVKKGDIFQYDVLEKIKYLTDEIKFYPDAITSQVISISRYKVKNIKGTAGGIDIRPFLWPKIPSTPEGMRALREEILNNEMYYGSLVSLDTKAVLITANFKEGINYYALFKFIRGLINRVEDSKLNIYVSGRPMLLGWIYNNNSKSFIIFVVSVLVEFVLLAIFLARFRWIFVPIPLIIGLINGVWGLGIMGMVGFNFDPLGLVIPFVIGARVISHSIQMLERYVEEYKANRDVNLACERTIETMLIPSLSSIITDAAGLYIVSIIPIPLLRNLGFVAGTWLLTAIIGVSIFNPILFSYVGAPNINEKEDILKRCLRWLGNKVFLNRSYRPSVILGCWFIILFGGLVLTRNLQIGDAHPGSSILWPDSGYNRDDKEINKRFPGTDPLYVILEGKGRDTMKSPAVLNAIERFERYMKEGVRLGGTESLVRVVKKLNGEFHEGDPKWAVLPKDKNDLAFYLWMYQSKGEPRDFDKYTDVDYKDGNIIVFFKNHKGITIRNAIKRAKDFLNKYPIPVNEVKFKLAGGIIGTTAAVNEVVGKYERITFFLALLVIFICCVISFKSFIAGLILVLPLVIANYVAYSYMVLAKIGFTINVLPVASIGVGIGVDYGIYMLSRIIDEFRISKDLVSSILNSISTTGHAVIVTGLTVTFGIVFWYFSDIRFQAEMGFLLAFLLFVNVFGAILLTPVLVYLINPKFIRR